MTEVRQRNSVPWTEFDEIQKELQYNDAQMCRALGYNATSVIYNWRKSGMCPKIAIYAAIGVLMEDTYNKYLEHLNER